MAGRTAGQGSNWIRKEKREALYHRDHDCCVYCGKHLHPGEHTLDHVLACELGGTNEASNLVTACQHCNSSKQDMSLRNWLKALSLRGIETDGLAARIRRQTRKPLDLEAGRERMEAKAVRMAA